MQAISWNGRGFSSGSTELNDGCLIGICISSSARSFEHPCVEGDVENVKNIDDNVLIDGS